LGIGWGSIGNILGQDERGAGLNSSNIFLEIWLGSGILGFLAFLAVWVYIPFRTVLNFARTINSEEKAFAIFSLTAWLGLTIANLFNAGILLGFLWLFIAIILIDLQPNANRN
jgi:O-antigen ligase